MPAEHRDHHDRSVTRATMNTSSKGTARITVSTITLQGDADGAPRPDPASYAAKYVGKYEHRAVTGGIGHNPPQEAPRELAQAIVDVDRF